MKIDENRCFIVTILWHDGAFSWGLGDGFPNVSHGFPGLVVCCVMDSLDVLGRWSHLRICNL